MSYEQDRARVSEHWSEQAADWRIGQGIRWLEHPSVQARINLKVSGRADVDRYGYFVQKYFAGRTPVDRVLTLGCGAGEFERGLTTYGFCREHDAVDISDGAIDRAIRDAREAGWHHIHYSVADLNVIDLGRAQYDVVFGISSVHHVAALERLFDQVSASLKPDGLFFMDEFVGPSQFQWTDQQLEAINDELQRLPAALRRRVTDPKTLKPLVARPSIQGMNAVDPSEAIRSAEILPLLPRYFDVLEVKGQGGSLLHMLLDDIAGNFDVRDPGAQFHLKRLFDLEDLLIERGTLDHDFATIVARKKPQAV